MFKRILILLAYILLLTSCHESYNSIYEDIEEKDPNVESPEEVDVRKVKILPTLSDPLYSISAGMTDGEIWGEGNASARYAAKDADAPHGPYGPWEEDKEHWLGTRFHTFGLLTSNMVGGQADYPAAKNGDKRAGVLWNVPLRIVDQQGHTNFYDENGKATDYLYNTEEALYRYKFFLLGMDGQDAEFSTDGKNRILSHVKLDGRRDIVHSYAYHTDKQYENAVNELPNDQTTMAFLTGGPEFMYNRLSGNRGIHPIFPLNHLMSRFDIYVRGANGVDSDDYDFLKVLVTGVSLVAHDEVNIVVADDAWERDSYIEDFNTNKLLQPLGQPKPCKMDIISNEFRNTNLTQIYRSDIDFDLLAQEAEEASLTTGRPVLPETYHWVSSLERIQMCKSMLMPPLPTENGQFMIKFDYRYLFTRQDEETRKYHLGMLPDDNSFGNFCQDYTEYVLVPNVDVDGNPVIYRGGKRYSIFITVYGWSFIKIDVIQALKWENGGTITPESRKEINK